VAKQQPGEGAAADGAADPPTEERPLSPAERISAKLQQLQAAYNRRARHQQQQEPRKKKWDGLPEVVVHSAAPRPRLQEVADLLDYIRQVSVLWSSR